MTGKRWEGYLPAQVDLDCSGQTHSVSWQAGELIPVDHADVSGECTLAALAREHVPCFELIDLWNRHVDDLRVLALASRGPGDPLTPIHGPTFGILPPVPASMQLRQATGVATSMSRAVLSAGPRASGVVAAAALGAVTATPAQGGPMDEPLVRLLAMGGPFADRLVATVAATWVERLKTRPEESSKHMPALKAALYGRVLASVRTWLGVPLLAVDVDLLDEGRNPSATRNDAGIRISVPFSWIAAVWGRGLAVVLGRLVLAVEEVTENRLTLLAVSPDFGDTAPVTITLG